ncbi:hypothetical protein PVAND_010576 [Polypedilum vanderplanki]|uniref:Uncharacterized protein n=1 Tax=Polypedilum vanderplanki TaxID=319348 RepID=A0A9J6CGE2_POLVA|nr:hypothetical protein PVAND_010576 [Polypedilum vanderplanki]
MAYSIEEESKKNRVFQREKRLELQLIIEQCNKISFEYVKVPSERHDNVVFGSSKPRSIHFFADDKSVNSFMRRNFKEHFPEPSHIVTQTKKLYVDENIEKEHKLSYPFSSKVPRFQEIISIDSSQVYRRKKRTQESTQHTIRPIFSAFGISLSSKRSFMITGDKKKNPEVPLSSYIESKNKPICNIPPAYDIICSSKNIDSQCDMCENEIKNVYWKNSKIHSILCRSCYNDQLLKIKNKSKSANERFRKLDIMEKEYKKKRNCSFFHNHNGTKAHIYILSPKEFKKRRQREDLLNTILKY